MDNLSKLNLVELNENELQEINGGDLGLGGITDLLSGLLGTVLDLVTGLLDSLLGGLLGGIL